MIAKLRHHRRWLATGLALGAGCCAGTAYAAFSSVSSNGPNNFSADSDLRAPTVTASVMGKSQGGEPGYVSPGGTAHFYANLTDAGSPASGTASASANDGAGPAALSAGSFSIGGVSYNWRSGSYTVPAYANGSRSYTVTATDSAGNQSSPASYSVTIDGTAPTATDVQTANVGATVGRPELNDTATFSFSEPIDPQSVLVGWTGASTDVVARIANSGTQDLLTVYDSANTTLLPLGTVNLKQDYVNANATFGVTGTKSKLVRTGNNIILTLGTPSAGPRTGNNGTMTWTTAAGPYDRAGNALTSAAVNETGAGDREF